MIGRLRRKGLVLAWLFIGLACGSRSAWAQQPNDFDAIRQLLQRFIGVINDPGFATATRAQRIERLRPYFRVDPATGQDAPVFFGPLSEPVARGVESHLENQALNFEWIFRRGLRYGTRIDEAQIEVGAGLAVVMAVTTSGYSSADGKTNYKSRGRTTAVLTKSNDGQWLIAHEHSEMYNPESPAIMTKTKLTTELTKLGPAPGR